jgi:hypothetical protein
MIRDLTELDGCGFVLELEDGSQLEPLLDRCGTVSEPRETLDNSIQDFEWVDRKKVMIDYENIDMVTICMVGQTVKVTCISERTPNGN